MGISSIAPYLISYLLGVATPIVVAMLFFRGQDNERDNSCLLIGLLIIILVVIVAIIYIWAVGGV